jgi:predicted HNH restriction endonuclease
MKSGTYTCIFCGGSSTTQNIYTCKMKYCSNSCQNKHKNTLLIENWKNGRISGLAAGDRVNRTIRKYLIEQAGGKCEECGWNKKNPITGRSPLQIHHIDGISDNCGPSNMKVLCPNCHSLTDTYMALNIGRGSKKRLEYGRLV